MEEETKRHVDELLYFSRFYLRTGSKESFKVLFDHMREYYSYIHGEVCPFHILEKVKKKGEK